VDRPPGEGPGQPGVDGPEGELAGLGPAPVGIGQVQQEGELGGRGVGGQAQALGLEGEAGPHRAQVLPAHAGADRGARRPLPADRRRPLVGDPHPGHRPGPGGQRLGGDLEGGAGQLGRVELDEVGHRGGGQHLAVHGGGHLARFRHHRGPHPAGARVDGQHRARLAHGVTGAGCGRRPRTRPGSRRTWRRGLR
jgi:hypothetical protein